MNKPNIPLEAYPVSSSVRPVELLKSGKIICTYFYYTKLQVFSNSIDKEKHSFTDNNTNSSKQVDNIILTPEIN